MLGLSTKAKRCHRRESIGHTKGIRALLPHHLVGSPNVQREFICWTAPVVIPSYIRAITSPVQSPQPIYARTLTNHDHPTISRNTPTPSLARLSPSYERGQNAGAMVNPLIDFTADFEDGGTFQEFLEQLVNMPMAGLEFPDITSPKTLGLGSRDNSTRPGHSRHNSSAPHEQLRQHDGAWGVQPTRERSTSCSATDWRTFLKLSPVITSADCPSDLDLGPLQDTQERFSAQYSSNTSPKLAITNGNPPYLDGSHSLPVTSASRCWDSFNALVDSEIDPEAIITPLQLLKSQLCTLIRDYPSIQRNRVAGYEPVMVILSKTIGSEWLLDGIKELLCSTYEAAARFARGSIAGPRFPIIDRSLFLTSEEHRDDQADRQLTALQAKLTTCCGYWSPSGTLRIRLETTSKSTDIHGRQPLSSVDVSFFPSAKIRTTGVSITSVKMPGLKSSTPIPWHITTVNVVPRDADIIRRVRQGNLQAVRRLFEKGEASARDVDPSGFSLLSVRKLSLNAQGYKLTVN